LLRLKVTIDTYVQAVSDEKCKAQSKVVKMLLRGVRKGKRSSLMDPRRKWDSLQMIDSIAVPPYGNRPCRRREREAK
jgi:hypothetical protein